MFEYVKDGVKETNVSYYDDGRRVESVFRCRFPTEKRAADPYFRTGRFFIFGFCTPVDDTHVMVFTVSKFKKGEERHVQLNFGGKSWDQMATSERRAAPGDYESQTGQGPITLHSEERLGTTDRGIVMLRRALRKQIEIVQAGGDPEGVIFDPIQQVIEVEEGNIFTDPQPAPAGN